MTLQEALTFLAVTVRVYGDNDVLVLQQSVYEELADALSFDVNQDPETGDVTLHLVEVEG